MIKRYTENDIEILADILKNDGIICVPTDTVYGLCARISSINAYNKLLNAKNRPAEKAFPVMCANGEQIKKIAVIDEKAEKLINAFMPGPITLVLKKMASLPDYVTNGKSTIAVRMATSDILRKIIEKVGCPVFMTSANKSGEPTCTSLEQVETTCLNIDGMLEGNIGYGKASTIVDCTAKETKILREGPISEEQIKKLI